MKISCLETEQSVGRVICHDITKIERGSFKGPLFKKGHRIRPEDVPLLLDLGKKHIFSIELDPGELHEDDAGTRIAVALKGDGLRVEGPSEGRLNLVALHRGLLKVDRQRLLELNSFEDVIVSTLHTNSPVEAGEKVAGAKVIPLVVAGEVVEQVEKICAADQAVIRVLPYRQLQLGVVVTGREVTEGRIKDGFAPVLKEKADAYQLAQPLVVYAEDDPGIISRRILELIDQGCGAVIVTGGMSVDPDDVTPSGIKKTGATVIKYGSPVLPGAMFLLAYKGDLPVIGLPACAMYFRTTVLDILLPRMIAGEKVTAREIIELAHGGLCRGCERCLFPHCSFGKGG